MNIRNVFVVVALFVLVAQVGCGFGPPDPLLFDGSGNLRSTVSMLEVDEAGIPRGCNDLDSVVNDEDVVFVPITGDEDEPVLIGIGGQALCVEDEGDDFDGGDLQDIEVEDEVGPEDDEAISLTDRGDDERSDHDVTLIGSGTRGQDPGQPPPILADPTPEPAND